MRNLLAILSVTVCLATIPLSAQEGLPRGKWWKQPEIVKHLGISSDQQTRLDQIFRNHANVLIDTRGEVEKATLSLRSELDQNQLNRKEIQAAASQLNLARARLFEEELMMLVDMRNALSAEQWKQVRSGLESRRQRSGQQSPRNPRRRPGVRKVP